MDDNNTTPTNELLGAAVRQLTRDFMEYSLETAAVQRALVAKGLLSEAELLEARNQLLRAQIERIGRTVRQQPSERVQ